MHRALVSKPAGCVVLILPTVSTDGTRIELSYRYFGTTAALDLAGFKPARNTLRSLGADRKPYFKERLMHVTVAVAKFTKATTMFGLLENLFDKPPTVT